MQLNIPDEEFDAQAIAAAMRALVHALMMAMPMSRPEATDLAKAALLGGYPNRGQP